MPFLVFAVRKVDSVRHKAYERSAMLERLLSSISSYLLDRKSPAVASSSLNVMVADKLPPGSNQA